MRIFTKHIERTFLLLGCSIALSSCTETTDFQAMQTTMASNPAYSAQISMPAIIQAGEPTPLKLRVLKDGSPASAPEGERMILLVFAGPTLEDLDFWMSPWPFLFPGDYDLGHTFARPGTYRAWMEVADNTASDHHASRASIIAFTDLTVVEGGGLALAPEQDTNEGYDMTFDRTTLTVLLRNPQGESIPFIEGEPFMYMFVRDDFSSYTLNHGRASSDLQTGMIPESFPAPGTYHLLISANFFDAGLVRSVKKRFTVEVSR